MNTSTLFKLRTLVGAFLILGVSSFAQGQAVQAPCYQGAYDNCKAQPKSDHKVCVAEARACSGGAITSGCDADYNKVKDSLAKFNTSCSKAKMGATVACLEKANECADAAEDEDVQMPEWYDSIFGGAENMVKKCPIKTGKDNQSDIKDTTRELKDAKEKMAKLQKDMITDAKKAKDDMAELNTKLADLEQKKGQDEAALSQKQTEDKAKASQAMNDAQNSLQELNTAILNAQTKRAQAEAKKAEELAGLSQALISMNCEAEIKNALAKGGKQKAGSASNLIRARGIQKKATEESFKQCVQAMLAKRKGVIATYDGAIKGLDDEMNKNMSRIDQVQGSLKQMEAAAAQQSALMQKEGTDAEKKYYSDRANLYQQITDLSEATQAQQYQTQQEINEMTADIKKLSNKLALAEQHPVSNTETSDDAMGAASAFGNELSSFKSACCGSGSSYDACSWKDDGSKTGGASGAAGAK